MKKILIAVAVLLILTAVIIYAFIPAEKTFHFQVSVNCAQNAALRNIINEKQWQGWWPGKKINDTTYVFGNYKYNLHQLMADGYLINVHNNDYSLKGYLQISEQAYTSSSFNFSGGALFTSNPFEKILLYNQYKKASQNVQDLLVKMQAFFNNQNNIYGFNVSEQKVQDTSYISTKQSFNHNPQTQEIYSMIQSLEDYIKANNGKTKGYPMLNIFTADSLTYQAMAAIPTEKDLPSGEKFQLKKMVLGNILVAEITGGDKTIANAQAQLKNYMIDYGKEAAAIPFQSLITNRLQQADTTKWKTRLYYPVFH